MENTTSRLSAEGPAKSRSINQSISVLLASENITAHALYNLSFRHVSKTSAETSETTWENPSRHSV